MATLANLSNIEKSTRSSHGMPEVRQLMPSQPRPLPTHIVRKYRGHALSAHTREHLYSTYLRIFVAAYMNSRGWSPLTPAQVDAHHNLATSLETVLEPHREGKYINAVCMLHHCHTVQSRALSVEQTLTSLNAQMRPARPLRSPHACRAIEDPGRRFPIFMTIMHTANEGRTAGAPGDSFHQDYTGRKGTRREWSINCA